MNMILAANRKNKEAQNLQLMVIKSTINNQHSYFKKKCTFGTVMLLLDIFTSTNYKRIFSKKLAA